MWQKEFSTGSNNKSTSSASDMDVSTTNPMVNSSDSVTHIEIIKPKTSTSRRVSGANRVVPLITSVWQRNSSDTSEMSITRTYRSILFESECSDDRKCQVCNCSFLSSAEVLNHLEKIHPNVPISQEPCFVCRKKFFCSLQLKTHLSKLHGVQYPEMICKICFMEFHTPIETKAHERKHDKAYNCTFCTSKFASEYFYQAHFDEHLTKLKPLVCQKCGKRFENAFTHRIHLKRHIQLHCVICGVLFSEELGLLEHFKTYGNERIKNFLKHTKLLDDEEDELENMLAMYNATTTNNTRETNVAEDIRGCMESILLSIESSCSNRLNRHSWEGTAGNATKLDCRLCTRKVSTAMALMEHHQVSHPRNRTCVFCGKRSSSVSQTQRHMATHIKHFLSSNASDSSSVLSNFNSCNVCKKSLCKCSGGGSSSKSCTNSITIKRRAKKEQIIGISKDTHISRHSKEKVSSEDKNRVLYYCNICHQGYVRLKFLEKHQAQHENVFTCEQCNKKFLTLKKLKFHISSHDAVRERRKYVCNLCPVFCFTHAGLRVHERIHTNERPYNCTICDKRFKRQEALKKHLKQVHCTDPITFSCRECKVRFNDRGNLVRHFLRIHKGLCRFICGVCGFRYGHNLDLKRHLKMKHDIDIPNIRGKIKKSMKEIYVIPPIGDNPTNAELTLKIKKIVEEEEEKFSDVLDLLNAAIDDDPTDPDDTDLHVNNCLLPNRACTQSCQDRTAEGDKLSSDIAIESEITIQETEQDLPESQGQTEYLPILESMNLQVCDLCSALFYPDSHYQQHILQRKVNACHQCPKMFCEQKSLQEHLDNEHSTSPIYRCGICLLDYTEKHELLEHMEALHGIILQFEVTADDISGASRKLYDTANLEENHIDMIPITVHEIEERRSVVNTSPGQETSLSISSVDASTLPQSTLSTPLAFRTPINVASLHLDTVKYVNLETATLHPPSEIFSSGSSSVVLIQSNIQSSVSDILQTEEVDVKPAVDESNKLTCMQCGKQFPEINRLLRHVNTHLGIKPFKCPMADCNKSFLEKCNLKVHLRYHTGERPYVCNECGKRMRYQRDYTIHLQMHQGLKPHQCTICQKTFQRQRDLNRHMLKHTGIKTHQCEVCNKLFGRCDELKAHRVCHANAQDITLLECDICKKCFKSKNPLRQHLILHSKVKAYQCPICKKKFALDVYLKSHLKIHQKQYIGCNKCLRKFTSNENLEAHLKAFHVDSMKGNAQKITHIKSILPEKLHVEMTENVLADIGSEMEIMDLEMHEDELLSAVSILNAENKSDTVYFHDLEQSLINMPAE